MIHAADHGTASDRRAIRRVLDDRSFENVSRQQVREILVRNGSVEYAMAAADRYAEQSRQASGPAGRKRVQAGPALGARLCGGAGEVDAGEPDWKWSWNKVDNYFADLFAPQDDQLKAVRRANREARLPEIDVSPVQGKFLYVLIQITQAKRVLEIGTLGGYSSIWMARALPKDGRIVTLEFEPRHAEVARANFRTAGVDDCVDIRVGHALTSLPQLAAEGARSIRPDLH